MDMKRKKKNCFFLSNIDPVGSLGLGIHLFRGNQEIKKNIKAIKANPNNNLKKERNIIMYSVIQ